MNSEKKYNVIVVEDEPLIRNNLIKKIEEADSTFVVTGSAHNGNAALAQITKAPVDLLVTDIKMPVMDGLQLIEKIYFDYPFMKIIIVSGYDDFSYAQKALRFGVTDYILKPINKEDLERVLRRLKMQFENNFEKIRRKYMPQSDTTPQEQLASDIAEYIRNNFSKQISLTDIAEMFYVNPAYVTKIFKKETGIVPSKYIQNLRINEAKKLLHDFPELEIKEISAITGYSDQAYFSRIFKKITGKSPIEFRDNSTDS